MATEIVQGFFISSLFSDPAYATIYHYSILEYLQKCWLINKLIELCFTKQYEHI